jgi:Putative binding domain, N-terminal/Viral BACON domain
MTRHRLLGALHAVFVVAILVVTPHPANAQPVIDPRFVEFTRSVDHDRTTSGGTPYVQFYSLAIFSQGGANPIDTIDLGKPTPDANGTIRVAFVPLMHFTPTVGVIYEARVSAVGSGGVGASTVSNTFTFQSSGCTAPTISPTSQTVVAGGGTGSVTVTATTGCPWTAASGASWITVTSGANGSGNGTVGFSVAANSGAARTGTMTIAGRTFTVNQNQSPGCTAPTISPTSQTVAAGGATGSVTVTATTGCPWTAASGASWITVTSGANGSGNGTVGFSVAANSGAARMGTMTIAGRTFTVNQSPACNYTLNPPNRTMPAGAGSGTVSVSVAAGCSWTARSNATWITATGSGSGPGSFTYSVTALSGSPRTGTVSVGTATFSITQGNTSVPTTPAGLRIRR